jgi:hypothetical protein
MTIWVACTGQRVLANMSTMSNEKPTEQENSETAEQSDESSAIQTISTGAPIGVRKRQNKSKKSSVSNFYASSDVENPPNLGSSPKVEASPIVQAFSEPDESQKVALREGFLFSGAWEDFCWLLRAFYPFYKWPIFFYVLRLIFSNSMISYYHTAARQLEPICDSYLIGQAIPFCSGPSEAPPLRSINVTKFVTSQEELNLVMNLAGQNFDLARDMVGHKFALRDLRIRSAASDLYRRREIANELESLIRVTEKTSK